MISRTIAWCARNPFLVFTGAILLTVAGVWSLQRVPLDALPDISDVQVVIHTNWPGEPPDVVEDQVTYPIRAAARLCRYCSFHCNPDERRKQAGPPSHSLTVRIVRSRFGVWNSHALTPKTYYTAGFCYT